MSYNVVNLGGGGEKATLKLINITWTHYAALE